MSIVVAHMPTSIPYLVPSGVTEPAAPTPPEDSGMVTALHTEVDQIAIIIEEVEVFSPTPGEYRRNVAAMTCHSPGEVAVSPPRAPPSQWSPRDFTFSSASCDE